MQSSQVCKIPVSGLGFNTPSHIALHCYFPEAKPRAVLYCLPGGACLSSYFDLDVAEDASYSFARTMAAKGYLVVTVDHLGLGESTQIENGYEVTLARVVQANAMAMAEFKREWDHLPQICVGHSMGAMLGICQQACYGGFDAMALLGFGHCGMPDFLCDLGKQLAETPQLAREQDVALATAQFGQGYLDFGADRDIRPEHAEGLKRALSKKQAPLLAVPGALTLVPNSVRDLAQTIELPCFAAMGDKDICGELAAQADLIAGKVHSVSLPNTRHNHFIFDGRHQLYTELDTWLKGQF